MGVLAGGIGDQADAQALERRKILVDKNVDAVEDARRRHCPRAGVPAAWRLARQRAWDGVKIEIRHRLGRERARRRGKAGPRCPCHRDGRGWRGK